MEGKKLYIKCLHFFNRDRSLRIGVFFIVLAILFWGKNNLSDEAHNDTTGAIIDKLFNLTQPINDLMVESKAWLNFFEISSSWCIDLTFFGMFLPWVYNGDSMRLILAYALFYGIRAGLQAICVLPYPDGMIWIFPVAPSFTVPFGVTSDFMPSGHVGFCAIAAAEFWKRKWYVLVVVSWLIGIYEIIVMLSARGHYFIDLFFGAIMAHYMHGWAHVLCTGFGPFCIDRIFGPYLLYRWDINPLNTKRMDLPSIAEEPATGVPATAPAANRAYGPVDAMSPETPGHGGNIELQRRHPDATVAGSLV